MLEETFVVNKISGHLLFSTYIPSVLIVTMSWIRSDMERKLLTPHHSFWIPPEGTPARVTLGVTSLLTLTTQVEQSDSKLTLSLSLQSMQTQQTLPPVSYTKAIDVWLATCVVFVFLRFSTEPEEKNIQCSNN